MIQTLWSLVAAVVAVGLEYTYRTMPAPWTNAWHLLVFALAQIFIGVSIYKIVTTPGTTLIGAFIVWSFATVLTRTLVSVFVLDERVPPGTWIAVGLLLMARVAQQVWR